MKALEIRESFGLDNLVIADRPKPDPGPGEVLVRMTAASLNYRDLLTVQGAYNPKQALPLIPCSDGVGEVVEVGQGVSRWAAGDRVATLFCQGWISGGPVWELVQSTLGDPLDGTMAEFMVLSEEGVVAVPDHLSDLEASTLTCAGVTAWNAITTADFVGEGSTVLVLGTGGVAIFALQIARALGARVIVISSSEEKLARARDLGAAAGVNYGEVPDWAVEVKKLTDGQGVDLVVEVGGAVPLPQSVRALRPGGQISLIGNLSGAVAELNLVPIFMRGLRIQGVVVGSREDFDALGRMVIEHRLRPVVDRVFPWTETRQALQYLGTGRHFGKICLRIS